MANMTLRLPEDLEQQIKASIQDSGISKHQFIINAIRDYLAGQVYQSLDAAQQVKDQLEGDRPITEVALDIKNALDMLQAQIHSLKEENKAIREDILKSKEEPEYQFKVGYEITKQSTVRYSLLMASEAYEQEWGKYGSKTRNTFRYHPDLGIITRQGTTKTGRKSFIVIATDLEDLQLSPEGYFISPIGNFGYDEEAWAKEAEALRGTPSTESKYSYQLKEDEEIVDAWQSGITSQYLHETFGIDHKDLYKYRTLDLCIDGVWTHFVKHDDISWSKTSYVRTINYEAKLIEGQINTLEGEIGRTKGKEQRDALKQQIKELEQKLEDVACK